MPQATAVHKLTADLIAQLEAHCDARARERAAAVLAALAPKAKRGRLRKAPRYFGPPKLLAHHGGLVVDVAENARLRKTR